MMIFLLAVSVRMGEWRMSRELLRIFKEGWRKTSGKELVVESCATIIIIKMGQDTEDRPGEDKDEHVPSRRCLRLLYLRKRHLDE